MHNKDLEQSAGTPPAQRHYSPDAMREWSEERNESMQKARIMKLQLRYGQLHYDTTKRAIALLVQRARAANRDYRSYGPCVVHDDDAQGICNRCQSIENQR